MTALLTGLGIGIAFWIVVIPCLLLLVKRAGDKQDYNEEYIKLHKDRMELEKEQHYETHQILVSIRNELVEMNTLHRK